MEIRAYKEGDEKQILTLFSEVFGREMSADYWYWRFRDNPAGKYLITLMWEGDKLVGHYAVSPVVLRVEGKEILTALSMTTMTHPDFGRRGIFGDLATALYTWLEKEIGVKAVWGFPNNNSHYAFIKKLAWQNIGIAHEIAVTSEKIALDRDTVNCSQSFHFTSEHELLLNNASNIVQVVKSPAYLNWRYTDHPTQQYFIFEHRTGLSLNGFLVAKKYQISKTETVINLVEIGGCEQEYVIRELLSFTRSFFGKEIGSISLWMSLFDPRYLEMEKIGFIPSGNNTYFSFLPFSEELEFMNSLNNWRYSFGDSDVY